ncbi:unnamed protein product, partial [Allacma fusca]
SKKLLRFCNCPGLRERRSEKYPKESGLFGPALLFRLTLHPN